MPFTLSNGPSNDITGTQFGKSPFRKNPWKLNANYTKPRQKVHSERTQTTQSRDKRLFHIKTCKGISFGTASLMRLETKPQKDVARSNEVPDRLELMAVDQFEQNSTLNIRRSTRLSKKCRAITTIFVFNRGPLYASLFKHFFGMLHSEPFNR